MRANETSEIRFVQRDFRDVGEHEAALPGWTQHYVQLAPGEFHGQVASLTFPGVTILRERMNLPMEVTEVAPKGVLSYFCLPRCMEAYRGGGVELAGGSFGLGQSWTYHGVCPANSDVLVILADRAGLPDSALPEEGTLRYGYYPEGVDFLAGWLTSLIAVHADGEAPETPDMTSLIPELIRDQLGLHYEHGLDLAVGGGADWRVFRLSRDWLGDNPREPATVSRLADALDLDASDLRRSWRAILGCPLDAILMARRLDGARRDIVAASETGRRISDIALDWGFFHWGRFSGRYKAFFGETPSDTKRRLGHREPSHGKKSPDGL